MDSAFLDVKNSLFSTYFRVVLVFSSSQVALNLSRQSLPYVSFSNCSIKSISLTHLLKNGGLSDFLRKKICLWATNEAKTIAFACNPETLISGEYQDMWGGYYCFSTQIWQNLKNIVPESVQRLALPKHMTYCSLTLMASRTHWTYGGEHIGICFHKFVIWIV